MPDPKDVPILFSAPMVRAILAGRKTATRRVLKPQPEEWLWPIYKRFPNQSGIARWGVGDRIWVRETCRADERGADCLDGVRYLADDAWLPIEPTQEAASKWIDLFHYRGRGTGRLGNVVPAIHMPRWASRITLEVTALRVERLQDISRDDAIAEGIYWSEDTQGWTTGRVDDASDFHTQDPVRSYEGLWDAINGPTAWQANPWVSVTTFQRVT